MSNPYFYEQQHARVDQLNERIYNRFVPDIYLETNLDTRPFSTKYSSPFPIVQPSTARKATEPLRRTPIYQVEIFHGGNARGPVSGYMSNIDNESILQNRTFALQKGLGQNAYIPDSKSDLYVNTIVSRLRPDEEPEPFRELFRPVAFDKSVHPNIKNNPEIGGDMFFNHTRYQLR